MSRDTIVVKRRTGESAYYLAADYVAAVAVVTTRALLGYQTGPQDLVDAILQLDRPAAERLLIDVRGAVNARCEAVCERIRQGSN